MTELESLEKLRELATDVNKSEIKDHDALYSLDQWLDAWHRAFGKALEALEREIAEKYMLKDDSKLEETAVQEYNVTVQVAAGQTIEYNTELRHRCGAATSISVAFRLE